MRGFRVILCPLVLAITERLFWRILGKEGLGVGSFELFVVFGYFFVGCWV